jgi:hypothetical protein
VQPKERPELERKSSWLDAASALAGMPGVKVTNE